MSAMGSFPERQLCRPLEPEVVIPLPAHFQPVRNAPSYQTFEHWRFPPESCH